MAGVQADVDSWEMSIYRYLSTTHRRRSLMDAMYWEHPIDLDKIRRLVCWRQMTRGRGGRHRHKHGGIAAGRAAPPARAGSAAATRAAASAARGWARCSAAWGVGRASAAAGAPAA